MMTQKLALALAVAALAMPRVSFADPPVDVEIADEEAQDFFSQPDEDEAETNDSRSQIKKNADAMFEELEATKKGAKIKRAKKQRAAGSDAGDESDNDNSNINQNVVNVVVVSGDKDTKAEAKNEIKNEVKSEVQEPASAPVTAPVTAKPAQSADSSLYYGHNTWKSWWEREPGLDDGDILVSFSSGGYGGGLYLGVGLEGMMSDTFGIKLSLNGTGFERFDEHARRNQEVHVNNGDWDLFLGGKTVAPQPGHNAVVDRAVLHLEDLSLVMHLGDGDGIDIFPSFGVSHFGYHIDTGDQQWTGGSAFVRAGVGMQYVYKRFFAGVELGWYPIELARYGIEKRNGDDKLIEKHIDDATDRKRITFSAMFGLSL